MFSVFWRPLTLTLQLQVTGVLHWHGNQLVCCLLWGMFFLFVLALFTFVFYFLLFFHFPLLPSYSTQHVAELFFKEGLERVVLSWFFNYFSWIRENILLHSIYWRVHGLIKSVAHFKNTASDESKCNSVLNWE